MDPKRSTSLFVIATALLLLLVAAFGPTTAEARGAIAVNPWCRTSDYKRLCTRMVNGATNQHDAATNAMKATLGLINKVQTMVPQLKSVITSLPPQSQESIMTTCTEDFSNRVDDIQDSLKAWEVNDLGTTQTKLTAAYSSNCVDELKSMGVECPFGKLVDFMQKYVDNCLAVVQQK